MKKILSISMTCLMFALSAAAQENVLEVLSVKGMVKWEKSGVGEPLNLQAYQRLLSDDKIIILDNKSNVRFVNNKNKFVAQLNKPGQYRVGSFLKDTSWHNDFKNFIDLILEEVKPDSGDSRFVVGGVNRGIQGQLYPPDQTIILQENITFKWNSGNESKQHFFIAKDKKLIIELSITDTTLTLSTRSEIMNRPGKYIWKGYNTDKNINPNCFFILNDRDRENLKKAIAAQKLARTGDEVLDLLELAKFYKQHNLFIEADSTYEQIVKQIR